MSVMLKTKRLILRRVTPADVKNIADMNADKMVMRYVGDGSVRSREQSAINVQRMIRNYQIYPGIGAWVAEDKKTRRFIGLFFLVYIPNTAQIEIGYRLPKSSWGKGYATEGATAVLRYGFEVVELERIVGLAYPANRPSRNVLTKIGLVDRGVGFYFGKNLCYYVGERARFLSSKKAV